MHQMKRLYENLGLTALVIALAAAVAVVVAANARGKAAEAAAAKDKTFLAENASRIAAARGVLAAAEKADLKEEHLAAILSAFCRKRSDARLTAYEPQKDGLVIEGEFRSQALVDLVNLLYAAAPASAIRVLDISAVEGRGEPFRAYIRLERAEKPRKSE